MQLHMRLKAVADTAELISGAKTRGNINKLCLGRLGMNIGKPLENENIS